jgi:hypothetical protein
MTGRRFSVAAAWPRGISRVRFPVGTIRACTVTAAAFNLAGMPVELLILRHWPAIPRWPVYLSTLAGAAILALAAGISSRRVARVAPRLFVLNAGVISFALYRVHAGLAEAHGVQSFFLASKLGALIAGMLAPELGAGLAAIAAHAGGSAVQYCLFPAAVRAAIGFQEPYATLAFGLGGIFILVHRLRVALLEQQASRIRTESEATRRLAVSFLQVRDFMNTPLQAIEIATVLLRKKGEDPEILSSLHRSCERLRELSESLKRYEHAIDWEEGLGEGQGPRGPE